MFFLEREKMSKSEKKMDPSNNDPLNSKEIKTFVDNVRDGITKNPPLLKEKVPTPNQEIDWCKFSKSSMFKKLDDETILPIMEVLKTCYCENELQSKSLIVSSIKTMCNSIFKMIAKARTTAGIHSDEIQKDISDRTQKADVMAGATTLEIPAQQVNQDSNNLLKLDNRLSVNTKHLNLWLNVLEYLGINIVENQKEVKDNFNDYVPFIWTGASNETKTRVAVKDAKDIASSYKDISTKNYL